jgi:alkyl hydroperoxide reductase subunit AhpC
VCTTELGALAKDYGEFSKRGVKVLAHSVDKVAKHVKWAKDVSEYAGMGRDTPLPFPIVEDADRKISEAYDMVDQEFSDEDG